MAEATRPEDHAASGVHVERRAVTPPGDDTDDPPGRVGDERLRLDAELDGDAHVEGGFQQAGDERIADHQPGATRIAQAVAPESERQLRQMQEGSRRAPHLQEVLNVGAIDHHPAEAHHSLRRRAQQLECRAETTAVELADLERAAAVGRAWKFRIVVRRERTHRIPDLGVVLQKRQRFRSPGQKCFDQFGAIALAKHVLQIQTRVVARILESAGHRLARARNPERAARDRRRPAQQGVPLEHHDLASCVRGGHGSGQRRGATPENQNVGEHDAYLLTGAGGTSPS